MDNLIHAALSNCWSKLEIDKSFQTPSGKSEFRILSIDIEKDEIKIEIGINRTNLTITKLALTKALKYLIAHGHFDQNTHCEIRSNNEYDEAGPLCKYVRESNEPRTITYILPILKFFGFVELANVNGLNSTWLT